MKKWLSRAASAAASVFLVVGAYVGGEAVPNPAGGLAVAAILLLCWVAYYNIDWASANER